MAAHRLPRRNIASALPRNAARARGFTLVELLTVVVVLVVLTTIAVPAFNELTASQRVQMAAMDLFTSLLRARSEAIKQNTDVTLSSAGTWDAGWAVAVGGTNIDTHAATNNISISNPGVVTVVTYRSSGRVAGSTKPKFSVSATQTAAKRCVQVNLSGAPVVTSGACS
ncbi:MAG TPA: GspH/FimT family protein [Casimicrobiaceae bacterium]|nr:GspH/FimT family protein [Casimicrobiaceae bacterium]